MSLREHTPPTAPEWRSLVFLYEKDERTTTISSLLEVIEHATHSLSGELLDHKRDALSWLVYLTKELVADDRAAIYQEAYERGFQAGSEPPKSPAQPQCRRARHIF